jgi:hypothetical protein
MATDTLDLVPSSVELGSDELPGGSALLRVTAGPNPFRTEVAMGISLGRAARIALEVYDVQGRYVAEVASGTFLAGDHRLSWNGQDSGGRDAGSGIFWMRLRVDGLTETRRVLRFR